MRDGRPGLIRGSSRTCGIQQQEQAGFHRLFYYGKFTFEFSYLNLELQRLRKSIDIAY
jgi:hypothetical protein